MRTIEGENELLLTCAEAPDGVSILRCETRDDDVRLPDEIGGAPVVSLGGYALSERAPDLTGRGTFRVRGDTIEIIPVYEELAIRIEMFGDEIDFGHAAGAPANRGRAHVLQLPPSGNAGTHRLGARFRRGYADELPRAAPYPPARRPGTADLPAQDPRRAHGRAGRGIRPPRHPGAVAVGGRGG